ncbi:hypothetical protein [Limibacterium fermenti]|uniref:hypothetical protein n=1 Tax=Limibacterium fermenti TaxID=3229863 RepID=UPI000E8E4D61|nr:hypothetical protein [Porphyromonadaceae bacterium]
MLSDQRNKDIPDDFSLQAREKLHNHRVPVRPEVWNELENKLYSKRKIRRAYFLWGAVAAAILTGILFVLNPFITGRPDQLVTETAPLHATEAIDTHSQQPEKKPAQVMQRTERLLLAKHSATRTERIPETATRSVIADYLQRQRDTHRKAPPLHMTTAEKNEPPHEEGDSFGQTGESTEQASTQALPASPPLQTAGNDRKHSLIARLGGGGQTLGKETAGSYLYMNDLPLGGRTDYLASDGEAIGQETLKPSDFTQIRHLPPLSLSLTADIPLNHRWSIETGLKYTYLSSLFDKPGTVVYRGSLSLHYLGIPVNLKAMVYEKDAWNVYALAGGTLEKGVLSIYKQEIEDSKGDVERITVRSGIDGIQLSANVAAGFEYRLTKRIRIFGEPQVIYYFNNNQPMSARTQDPLVFGLNAGVRVRF